MPLLRLRSYLRQNANAGFSYGATAGTGDIYQTMQARRIHLYEMRLALSNQIQLLENGDQFLSCRVLGYRSGTAKNHSGSNILF